MTYIKRVSGTSAGRWAPYIALHTSEFCVFNARNCYIHMSFISLFSSTPGPDWQELASVTRQNKPRCFVTDYKCASCWAVPSAHAQEDNERNVNSGGVVGPVLIRALSFPVRHVLLPKHSARKSTVTPGRPRGGMSAERACAFIVYCNKIKERKKKKTSKEWRVVKRDIVGRFISECTICGFYISKRAKSSCT